MQITTVRHKAWRVLSQVQAKNADEHLNINKKTLSVPQTNSQHSPKPLAEFQHKTCSLSHAIREAMPGGRYGDHSPGIISGFALTAVKKESAFPFLHHDLYNYHPFKMPYEKYLEIYSLN